MDLNRAQVIGNVVRDPEVRTTPSGDNVCSFSVATNLVWKDSSGQKQSKPEYHNIVAWRKLAEICGQYLKKGRKVYVEGRLQTRSWDDQNGVKKFRTEIVADNMILLDRAEHGGGPAEPEAPAPEEVPPSANQTTKSPANPPAGETEIKVEDIPF